MSALTTAYVSYRIAKPAAKGSFTIVGIVGMVTIYMMVAAFVASVAALALVYFVTAFLVSPKTAGRHWAALSRWAARRR